MSKIDRDMDEDMYHETTLLHKRHLTDAVLRVPLKQVKQGRDTVVLPEDATIQAVVVAMREGKTGAVLLAAKGSGKAVGIFTERDLLLRVAGHGWNFLEKKVKEYATPNPHCLTPDHQVGYALNLMTTRGYRHIPLVDAKGKPIGLLSLRDLLVYLTDYFPEDVINLPPEVLVPTERDGG